MVGFCNHGNELVRLKRGEFLDEINIYVLTCKETDGRHKLGRLSLILEKR